jgi:hypothetical protein
VDRYKLIILLFLFIASPVHAGMMMMTGDGTSAAACTDANPVGNCTGFLICQNFETTCETPEACTTCNEDNSESWVKTIGGDGTITVDYGTALRGSQSLQVTAAGSVSSLITETFSAQDTIYGFFRLQVADGRPSSTSQVLGLSYNSTGIGGVSITTAGKLRVYHGTANAESTTTLDDGASGTLYVWFYWTKGTGDNGTMGIEVNTSRTFGAWEAEGTTGTATDQVNTVRGTDRYIGGVVLDQILIKTTAIGTVCE